MKLISVQAMELQGLSICKKNVVELTIWLLHAWSDSS
jgi:hypothetical protein